MQYAIQFCMKQSELNTARLAPPPEMGIHVCSTSSASLRLVPADLAIQSGGCLRLIALCLTPLFLIMRCNVRTHLYAVIQNEWQNPKLEKLM